MKFEREPWRKLYVSESLEHRALPLFTRGLRDYLLRFAGPDGTILRSTSDPASDLYRTLIGHPSEAKKLKDAVASLIAVGFLEHASGCLRIAKFERAQAERTSNAERQARYRSRKSTESLTPERYGNVTRNADSNAQRNVTGDVTRCNTGNVTVTLPVTSRVTSPELREEKRSDDDEDPRTRQVARAGAPPSSSSAAAPAPEAEPVDKRFAMHPGWSLDERTRSSLEVEMIPDWAIARIAQQAITHFAAGDDRCTDAVWRQRIAKWVRRDWHDPNRRPRQDGLAKADAKAGNPPELADWQGYHAPR